MRIRDMAIGLAFLAGLVAIGWGAMLLGERAGAPDPVEADPPPSFAPEGPPVGDALYGFETLGNSLRLGDWGEVTNIEQQEDGSFLVTIERDGNTSTITFAEVEILRAVSAGEVEKGDAVAVRESDGGVAILVTR